ncbi:MAG: hypothetical protein IKT00_11540 [Prevotella sp.]|nr:hypothetical protein [Prevotella sp.]
MMLPDAFCKRTRALLGDERWSVMERALGDEPTVSVRTNPWKSAGCCHHDDWQIDGMVPWCSDGLYLKERPVFTFDPLFHTGAYYVQEASSMFVSHVVRQLTQPIRDISLTVLDMCAAPGGKSTAILGALPHGSILFANEPIRLRANILAENLSKFGYPNVVVTNNYPKDYERSGLTFDIVLCDVPCSGEGMFRKDAVAIEEWSEEHVKRCSHLQREIVESAWKVLRPGGFLIYSTCTFNREENEDNVQWMVDELGAEPWPIEHDGEWGIQGSMTDDYAGPCYRFLPGFIRGEGLFMAVLRKKPSTEEGHKDHKATKKTIKLSKEEQELLSWMYVIRNENGWALKMVNNVYSAIRCDWMYETDVALKHLRVLQAGVPLAMKKGKELKPDHRWTLSIARKPGVFPKIPLQYTQAIHYLRGESLVLNDAPMGYLLVCYQGETLGFVKNIGNRANNLYPAEWRVKKVLQ